MRPHPFNELLREAFFTSENADLFDVHSDDPASKARWDELRVIASQAEQALVDHILETEKASG